MAGKAPHAAVLTDLSRSGKDLSIMIYIYLNNDMCFRGNVQKKESLRVLNTVLWISVEKAVDFEIKLQYDIVANDDVGIKIERLYKIMLWNLRLGFIAVFIVR